MKLWGILVGGAALSLAAPAHALVHTTTVPLEVSQETTPPTGTTGATTGSATVNYDDVTNIITYNITYAGLTGAVNAAHFHGPAARGATAPPVITLTVMTSPMSGTTRALTAGEETELLNGQWYINLHTATNSGGEIRGQVEFAAADGGAEAGPAEGGADAATDGAAPTDASMDGAVSDAEADGAVTDAGGAGGAAGGAGGATGGRGGGAGSGGTAGRGGSAGTGGRVATGGTAGTAPVDAGDEGGDSDDDGGCGCSVPGSRTSSGALLASLALFGIASARRRRRS